MQGPHLATSAPPTYGAADLAVWRCLSTEKSAEVPSSSGGMYCTGQEKVGWEGKISGFQHREARLMNTDLLLPKPLASTTRLCLASTAKLLKLSPIHPTHINGAHAQRDRRLLPL